MTNLRFLAVLLVLATVCWQANSLHTHTWHIAPGFNSGDHDKLTIQPLCNCVALMKENNKLMKEKTQLKTNYDALMKEKNQCLQDKSHLQRELKKRKHQTKPCASGWKKFKGSCYYRTHLGPGTWQESRDYCRILGADLVSINSKEEQAFIWILLDWSVQDCGQMDVGGWNTTDNNVLGQWTSCEPRIVPDIQLCIQLLLRGPPFQVVQLSMYMENSLNL